MHRFTDSHKLYNLFILTTDYSKNFTTMKLLTIDEWQCLWLYLFILKLMASLCVYHCKSSSKLIFSPFCTFLLFLYKVNHKQDVCFLLNLLGQIVT